MSKLLIAVIFVTLFVAKASAQSDCSVVCTGKDRCKIKDLAEDAMKNATYGVSGWKEKAACCVDSGSGCSQDPCTKYLTRDLCVSDPKCINRGSSYQMSTSCISRDKLCMSYDKDGCNMTQAFCQWHAEGYCFFNTSTPGSNADVNCPGMHPFVVAMIVLIFLTIIIGVIIIVVMIIVVRKRRDEEERIEEEKNAEAAIQHSKIQPGQAASTVGAALAQPTGSANDDMMYEAQGYTGEEAGYAANTGYDPNDPNNYDANAYADYQGYDATEQEQPQQEAAGDIDINEDDY